MPFCPTLLQCAFQINQSSVICCCSELFSAPLKLTVNVSRDGVSANHSEQPGQSFTTLIKEKVFLTTSLNLLYETIPLVLCL